MRMVFDLNDKADKKLLKAELDVKYCLHLLMPPVCDSFGRHLRKRGDHFVLSLVRTNLHKESLILRCIFKYA